MTLPTSFSVSEADISDDGLYRYSLRRRWRDGPTCLFVMLNPSTADATQLDPTLRRCLGFADAWGYGEFTVANLFAYRATDPKVMAAASDPVGPRNDATIAMLTYQSSMVIAGWGAHPKVVSRAKRVVAIIRANNREPLCLGLTKSGWPRHPLYLPANCERMAVP